MRQNVVHIAENPVHTQNIHSVHTTHRLYDQHQMTCSPFKAISLCRCFPFHSNFMHFVYRFYWRFAICVRTKPWLRRFVTMLHILVVYSERVSLWSCFHFDAYKIANYFFCFCCESRCDGAMEQWCTCTHVLLRRKLNQNICFFVPYTLFYFYSVFRPLKINCDAK